MRPQRVTNAEFVDCVDIRRGQICDHQIRAEQIVVHRLVDDGGVDNFVCTQANVAGRFDGRLDDVCVGSVQIQDALRV